MIIDTRQGSYSNHEQNIVFRDVKYELQIKKKIWNSYQLIDSFIDLIRQKFTTINNLMQISHTVLYTHGSYKIDDQISSQSISSESTNRLQTETCQSNILSKSNCTNSFSAMVAAIIFV